MMSHMYYFPVFDSCYFVFNLGIAVVLKQVAIPVKGDKHFSMI